MYTQKWINANAGGDNTLVAAVPGAKIKLVWLFVYVEEAVEVCLTSAAAAVSPVWKFTQDNKGFEIGSNARGAEAIFEGAAGEALVVNVSAADKDVAVSCLYYLE
jgi:hypothetical protein